MNTHGKSAGAPSLGHLVRGDPRTVWPGEATDFTPWLALDENLRLLGEAIGIELEFEASEKNVGPFKADILCKNTATDEWVLVENQLARTGHTHLGQLLTYAAGLRAVTIVWIANPFTEEHRAALDWLNTITDTRFNFFGLEIELWRINDSPYAPKFNVVVKPNDWSKTVSEGAARVELTETKQLQLDFWTEFRSQVPRTSSVTPTKPLPQHWMNVALGKTGFGLSAIASMWNSAHNHYDTNEVRVEMIITDSASDHYFELLRAEQSEIHTELGRTLTWQEPTDGVTTRKAYVRRDADLADRAGWPELHHWLLRNLEDFKRVFGERVKRLPPPSSVGE